MKNSSGSSVLLHQPRVTVSRRPPQNFKEIGKKEATTAAEHLLDPFAHIFSVHAWVPS